MYAWRQVIESKVVTGLATHVEKRLEKVSVKEE
jgi:hypothetical protein